MLNKKILINTRDLSYKGGVVNYFRVLKLNELDQIDYFIISKPDKNKIVYLISRYILFLRTISKYDIIQLNPSLGPRAIKRDIVFAFLAKIRRKKLICFFHGWDESYEHKINNSPLLKFLFLKTIGQSEAFFVLGSCFKEKLINIGVNKERAAFIIETMITDDKYLEENHILEKSASFLAREKTWRFLFMSRIVKNKGLELAIETFNLIQKKYPKISFEFYISGEGDLLPKIKDLVKKKNVENVIFTGFVSNEKKDAILKLCDIAFFPSYSEGLPNTIMEGMLYGLPIITRNVGGIPYWVKNDENGFITDSINPEDFIPFIEKLIFDPELCTNIARENNSVAEKYFLKNKVRERLINHYNEL